MQKIKLKTLAIVEWKRVDSGQWYGELEAVDGTKYITKVCASVATNGGFHAYVIVDGSLVHQSEHGSKNEGQLACVDALKRAIDLREGPDGQANNHSE